MFNGVVEFCRRNLKLIKKDYSEKVNLPIPFLLNTYKREWNFLLHDKSIISEPLI